MEKDLNFDEKLEEANLLLQYREFEEACALYEDLIKLNPNIAELRNNYGLALFYLDKFNEAIDEFKKAIELNKEFALPYSNIGLVYLNQGEYEKAVDSFLTALKLDPTNAETHYNLAVTYYRMNKKDEALKHYEEFIKNNDHRYEKLKTGIEKIIAQIKQQLQES